MLGDIEAPAVGVPQITVTDGGSLLATTTTWGFL